MRWYWLVPVTVISIPICFLIYPINEPRVRLADEATDINNNACRESELCCLLGNTSAPFYRICPGGYCFFHYETDVRTLREGEKKINWCAINFSSSSSAWQLSAGSFVILPGAGGV